MTVGWLGLSAVGAAVLAASVAGAVRPTIPAAEARAFHVVNGLPGWLFWVLWLPMQLGNLVVGTAAGLVAAGVAGEWEAALGVIVAAALKLLAEKVIRQRMEGHLAVRQRPGTSQVGAVVRGDDVPRQGPSFPSGHVVLVAAVASVVAPTLPPAWWWVPAALTLLVMLGRVYVGAHNPLDVTAGLGAGLLVGGVVAVFVR